MTQNKRAFSGAKIILHCDGALITYLRDDKPNIPFPAFWDLPGGGAEGHESPRDCAVRETFEEFGLHISKERLIWARKYPSVLHPGQDNWFFAAQISRHEINQIVFGDEGQLWQMMRFDVFITHTKAIPHLQAQVRDFLAEEISNIA
ncbi:NUDIX hydrolase [Planktotalea sp.]|uniref:NUDIX hydrolase n=1 Tax=Planktotalea sp. TaxID=2029877 RepID=UPI003D6ABE9D